MTISLKALLEKTRATQGRSDADQRSSSRLSHCRFRKCGKRTATVHRKTPGARSLLLADSCQRWKDHPHVIPQGPAVDRTRAQIAEYRRFRKLVQELIAVSEQLCNAQLQQPEALVAEG